MIDSFLQQETVSMSGYTTVIIGCIGTFRNDNAYGLLISGIDHTGLGKTGQHTCRFVESSLRSFQINFYNLTSRLISGILNRSFNRNAIFIYSDDGSICCICSIR